MKVKTAELKDTDLDWMIGQADDAAGATRQCSTNWTHGGVIIEREGISLRRDNGDWIATIEGNPKEYFAFDPLVAAMRCYVASKLGDEVELPDHLLQPKEVTRQAKIRALTDNDLGFVAAEWGRECSPDDAIRFYANGGFTKFSNKEIDKLYEQLTA